MSRSKIAGFFSDVWGLGTTIHELCAVSCPPSGNYAKKVAESEISLPIDFSQELNQLVSSMLETDYRHRPTIEQILSNKWVTDANVQRKTLFNE